MPRGRVLAVDDQRYFRELLEGLLEELGFAVDVASSGTEALDRLDHIDYDIVLTDLVMPAMSGSDLVKRIKERKPDQAVVVVTGVVDVQSAVDAMRVGADDYLLKPFDSTILKSCLDALLDQRRLRDERDRLLAENIEYLGERTLFERALALFSEVSTDALASKILAALETETGAQSSVMWLAGVSGGPFRLAAARGLVRIDNEQTQMAREDVPETLQKARSGPRSALSAGDLPSLWIALRSGGEWVGVVRLSDKLGGDRFDELDLACVDKFSEYAEGALANAARFARLEQTSLQDSATGAYRIEYLRDVVQNEIEKANRFGRTFALVAVGVGDLEPARSAMDGAAFEKWWSGFVQAVRRQLRATDFLAVDSDSRVWVRLAESDAIGAATFKRRARLALEACDALGGLPDIGDPVLQITAAIYPRDATRQDALEEQLRVGLSKDASRAQRDARFDQLTFSECLRSLLAEGADEPDANAASLMRFTVSEVGRRPRERNLFFFRPGDAFSDAVSGIPTQGSVGAEMIVIADPPETLPRNTHVAWLPVARLAGCPPFAVHYGDGPAYVIVCDDKAGANGRRLYHSSEPGLAEYLAFRLQRELRLPTLV